MDETLRYVDPCPSRFSLPAAPRGVPTNPAGAQAYVSRPGGAFSIDITTGDGQEFPNLGCFLEVVPQERLVWTSMLFPGYRPAVFDDIPITAIVTMESAGKGTRYVFTALHRNEADLEATKASGWQQGTEIVLDQFVALAESLTDRETSGP